MFSNETIRLWLIKENIVYTKVHKNTKKQLIEVLNRVTSKSKRNEIKLKLEELDIKIHTRRDRCEYYGEIIQMDAFKHKCINKIMWRIPVAIDNTLVLLQEIISAKKRVLIVFSLKY